MIGGGDHPLKTQWKLQGSGNWIIGEFQNGVVSIEGPEENKIFKTDASGKILQFLDVSPATLQQMKILFEPYFGEINNIKVLKVSDLEIGDDMPNWEDYKVLN